MRVSMSSWLQVRGEAGGRLGYGSIPGMLGYFRKNVKVMTAGPGADFAACDLASVPLSDPMVSAGGPLATASVSDEQKPASVLCTDYRVNFVGVFLMENS